jgi:hypothetical protein
MSLTRGDGETRARDVMGQQQRVAEPHDGIIIT